jgi:hypothetical protein
MRAIAEEAAELVRKYKGAFSGEHGDGLCRGEWIRWQFGPKLDDAFRAIKQHLDPAPVEPGQDHRPAEDGRRALFRFPPGYRTIPLNPVFDWSAWDVQNDPVTERPPRPGTGGDPTGGLAKAVEMCNNNGHCRKFDAGTMCPSYRVTRDEQHLTRGRANTLRLALSGQLGPDARLRRGARGAGPVRGLQGLQARLPDRRGHGQDEAGGGRAARKRATACTLKDRLIARLPDIAPWGQPLPWLFNLRNRVPGAGARWASAGWACRRKRSLPAWRSDTFWPPRPAATGHARQVLARRPWQGRGAVRRHLQRRLRDRERGGAVRVLQAAGYAVHVASRKPTAAPPVLRPHLLAAGMADEAKARAGGAARRLLPFARGRHRHRRPGAVVPADLRDEFLVMGLGDKAARGGRAGAAARGVPGPRGAGRPLCAGR